MVEDMDITDRQLTGIARPVQLTAGEVPAAGVVPAIANAVHHAAGRRIRDLPIRPETLI
jgi:xanthine dehydrogenase YagR molybdenum-binding subunit